MVLVMMRRPPRKKTDHLVTTKLVFAAYAIVGVYQAFAGFLIYFVIMEDFGFDGYGLFGTAIKPGFAPGHGAVYDPNALYLGQDSSKFINYCNACWDGSGPCDPSDLDDKLTDKEVDWLYSADQEVDLRLYFLQCTADGGYDYGATFVPCQVKQISGQTDLPVCYTTESLKFAQTGFFFAIVICQLVNIFVVKARTQSFMYSGLRNFNLIFGITTEVILCLFLAFLPPINTGLGTRELIFIHWGWAAVPFAIFQLFYDETRKYLIRNRPKTKDGKPNWFERNAWW